MRGEAFPVPVTVGVRRDRPPPADLRQWRDDVSGATWTPPGTNVEIVDARFVNVHIPRTRFEQLLVDGATFERVSFDHVEANAGDLGVTDGTIYRECTFDSCSFAEIDPGLARFDGCRFKACNLDGWFANCAEFVGCSFDGTSLRDTIFFGRPFECGDATRRQVNELIDDAAARVEAVAKEIRNWPELNRRRAARGSSRNPRADGGEAEAAGARSRAVHRAGAAGSRSRRLRAASAALTLLRSAQRSLDLGHRNQSDRRLIPLRLPRGRVARHSSPLRSARSPAARNTRSLLRCLECQR